MPTQPWSPAYVQARALASASAVVLFLGACSGANGEGSPVPSVSEAATAVEPHEHDTEVEAEVEAESIGYCAPAEQGYAAVGELLDATDRKSAQTGIPDESGDVAVMNEAGEQMLAHMTQVVTHWSEAQATLADGAVEAAGTSISGDDASAAFATYFEYLDTFARPDAHLAAESNSIAEYDSALADIMAAGAMEAIIDGSEALGTIVEFTVVRCGLTTLP